MTTARGPISVPAIEQPQRYSFVDVLEQLESSQPQAAAVGHLGPPAREAVRLRPLLSLAFPTADVSSVQARKSGPPWLVETTFLGLYGESSPLPTYVTEQLFVDEPNPTRDIIDILNHRLLSLAYRVLRKYRLTRRPELIGMAGRLAGVNPENGQPRHLLAFMGLLAQQPRSAGCLQAVLSAAFGGVAVMVEQCVPRWSSLPTDRLARLGRENCTLGGDCLLGNRIFNRSTAFGVTVGPIAGELFRRFLPGGDAMGTLGELIQEFNTEHLDYEVEIVVAGADLDASALGGTERLGWDTRLSGPPDALYRVHLTAAA